MAEVRFVVCNIEFKEDTLDLLNINDLDEIQLLLIPAGNYVGKKIVDAFNSKPEQSFIKVYEKEENQDERLSFECGQFESIKYELNHLREVGMRERIFIKLKAPVA